MPLDSGHTTWVLVSSALVLFMMIPGLALFYAGLVRTKNVLSVLMQCIALTAVLTLVWFVCGYSLAFDTTGMQAGVVNLHSFVGSFEKAFLSGVGVDSMSNSIPETAFFLFQLTFAVITPGLIVGAFAERMKFSALLAFSVLGDRSRAFFRPEMAASVAGMNPYEVGLSRLPVEERLAGRDPLNQALYLWARIHLPNFILTFLSDRMEMAHSIEGRVPFLDHHVAEYAAGIPIHMKINGMREKHVLREATRDVLIEPVYDRQKHPFSTPPSKVGARDALRELFGDVIGSSLLDEQPIFAPAAVRGLFGAFPGMPAEDRMRVDGLLNRIVSLTLMHQRFGMAA